MKKTVRKKILNHRKNLSIQELTAINKKFLTEFKTFFEEYCITYSPKIIGGYVSIRNEINVLPALDYCRQLGFKTALPFTHDTGNILTYHNFNGDIDSLVIDAYKIPAPDPNQEIVVPDLIICPAIGVQPKTLQRLGYGAGFFDRYKEKYPHIYFIAGFSDYQMIDMNEIFAPHDLIFNYIIKL